MKRVLVLGAGGFIGSHMVGRLQAEGCFVHGVDLKHPEFEETRAAVFTVGDLRDAGLVRKFMLGGYDEVYQFAADMGGAGYVFTGKNDLQIMTNSVAINLNVVNNADLCGKIFFSSSACIYPEYNQRTADKPMTREDSAYPASPDSEYGWEKLFAERMYQAYARTGGKIAIARFHNIYGPKGTWRGGKEKAPAAISRKVAEAKSGDKITIWGDGEQTRSFLYIADCIEAVRILMNSNFEGPVNIGSAEMVSINALTRLTMDIAQKDGLEIVHEDGPLGVRGRTSDNDLCKIKLGWTPAYSLAEGMRLTYNWVASQVQSNYGYRQW